MIARIIFGNRFAWLKFGLALGIVTLLSHQAEWYYSENNPSIGAIREAPDRHEGKKIDLPVRKIEEAGEGTFLLVDDRIPIRVRAPGTWTAGEYVVVHGTARGGEIEAGKVRRIPGYPWKRGLVYGFSVLVMAAILVGLLRHMDLRKGIFLPRN